MDSLEIEDKQQITQPDIQQHATQMQTLVKLIKCAIGSGIFAFPYAYMKAGLVWGVIIQLVILVFTFKSWCTMIDCIDSPMNYSLITYLEKNYGKESFIYKLTQVMSVIIIFGCGLSYIIIFNAVLLKLINHTDIYIQLLVAFSLFAIQFTSQFITKIDAFLPVLKLSVAFMVITIVLLCGLTGTIKNWQTTDSDFRHMFVAFGIMLFSYDINGVITEIKQEMNPQLNFKRILFISMVIETVIFITFGIVCSLAFGSSTNQMILDNFEGYDYTLAIVVILNIVVLIYASTLIVTNLVISIPAYFILTHDTELNKHILIRSFYITCQIGLAFIYPNFAQILSVIGCVCSVTLGFIIPFLLFLEKYHEASTNNQIINICVVGFGIVGGIVGVISSI